MRLKYNFIGLILACGLGLSSCNDSFLDRNPKDQLSDASFWKNAEKMPRNSQPESICI